MTSKAQKHRFLQLSNVNLESAALVAMGLDRESTLKRAQEVFATLLKALRAAKAQAVDSVFVVGNLWDTRMLGQETIAHVLEAFAQLGDLPVFIVPGKNDSYSADSPYNPHFIRALGLKPWSANVHILGQEQLERKQHPIHPDVNIFGHSFSADSRDLLKDWQTKIRQNKQALNILLLSEPVEGYFGSQDLADSERRMALTEKQIDALGADYVALGFGSNQSRLVDDRGRLIGAQAGTLVGQRFSETGPRVALFGELKREAGGAVECLVEPVEFDSRRIWTYSADTSGMTAADAVLDITQTLEELGARKGLDIIYLELEGRYQVGQEPSAIIEKIKESFYQAVVKDNTRPNYLSETFAAGSSEARFIKAMLVLKKEAEKRMAQEEASDNGEESPKGMAHLSGRIVEDALYYGLEALRQKRVNLRDVD